MDRNSQWRRFYAECDVATRKGEEISLATGFSEPPIDVFRILESERQFIRAVGEDFGESFDGRIRYLGNGFLLCYNTRYNEWLPRGRNRPHSKVLFSIAHELGHFYLDEHRACLVNNRRAHNSFTEFSSHKLIERQADHFASGLLMPSDLLRPRINMDNHPDFGRVLDVRKDFDVSLTGLLARWTQLSDFPCATVVTLNGVVLFGWVSKAFREIGCYRVRRTHKPESRTFRSFVAQNSPVKEYKQKDGYSSTDYWLEYDQRSFETSELYFAIPHSKLIWVLLTCDEGELCGKEYD
ncbi:MAG: ImmA/IrrE family metallo-endopeptidase [Planctomycetaceae bacterium]|nr:ImmA/IrrE family metallo-endopeptidase [Planctomycetaceae bacterium]